MRYLLLLLAFSACKMNESVVPEPKDTPSDVSFTYLALGDSYTIGESVEMEGRYPVQLVDRLRTDSIKVEAPVIIARTGWTTGELQQAINDEKPKKDYDLVSLLIGVNNQFRGNSTTIYETEFEKLLQQAITFAGGNKDRVFVISIPDYAYTPFGQRSNPDAISEGIDVFNAINERITKEKGIAYYNITPISREGIQKPILVAGDGLHPSGEQYGLWVNLFYEEVKAQLLAK